MDRKHSCVVDADGYYKTTILQWYREVYSLPPLDEDGTPDYSKVETHMEWVIDTYVLADGERLIDTGLPPMRPHAGADGLIKPRWDDEVETWVEGATAAEIAAWEAEHPAPELPGPTQQEQMRADIDFLAALGGVVL